MNIKKLIGILVILVYLLSFASIGSAQKNTDRPLAAMKENKEFLQGKLDKFQARVQAKAEKFEELSNKTNFKKYNKNLEFKARSLAKKNVEKARNNFLKAKEKFLSAKQKYLTAQANFLKAKNRVNECEGNETDACEQIREQIKEKAREQLMDTADMILEHLNKLKAKVEENEDLSEEEAAEMLAEIEEQIQEIEDAKDTIENSEEKDEIIEAAEVLKQAWNRIKNQAKIHAGRIVNARIGGIIVKSQHLELKLERILERMENNSKNTDGIQTLIDEFNSLIEDASASYDEAVAKFQEAKGSGKPNTSLIREAQAAMKSAHKSLQEAQKKLRDIVLSIKQAGGNEELDEEADEEEEETEEETTSEVSGDVELSEEAQSILDQLVASFEGVETNVTLKLEIKKENNETTVEKDELVGELTTEQQELWDDLKELATTLVEEAEGTDVELKIEVDHRVGE